MAGIDLSDPVVHVVDDDEAVRRSLGRLISAAGYGFIGHASAEDFEDAWQSGMQGCAIVDLHLPGLDGLGLQSRMAADGDGPEIVFLTGTGDIGKSVAAMKAGAVDFLTKPVNKADLLDAIRAALRRCDEKQAARRVDPELDQRLASLTRREREILEGILSGSLNKQIAADFGLSLATVKIHRGRIMHKLGVRTAAQLGSLAVARPAAARQMPQT